MFIIIDDTCFDFSILPILIRKVYLVFVCLQVFFILLPIIIRECDFKLVLKTKTEQMDFYYMPTKVKKKKV